MKGFVSIFTVLLVMVCVPALSFAQTFDVAAEDFFFSPADLTINAGDTVRWTNRTFTPHTSTSGSGCTHNTSGAAWDSGTLSNGQSFSFTFGQAGVYPYYCAFHCGIGMTGTIAVMAAPSLTIPVPQSAQSFAYSAVVLPSLSIDPAQAMPVGAGGIAAGGADLSIGVALDQFEAPVDIYFLLYVPDIDPVNVYQLTEGGLLQTVAQGLAPWKPASTGGINENLFGSIPVSVLPPATYFLGVMVTPPGDQSLTKYYIWVTQVTVVP